MRVRDWQDLIEDVVERDVDPEGWRAVAGDRASGVGEDMFLGHPAVGVFQLKTFARNPFDVRGVGARVARRVDDELDPLLPATEASARFAVNRRPSDQDEARRLGNRVEEVLRTHAETPTTPDALFEDVMSAVDAPAYGPMEYDQYGRPDALEELSGTFDEAESVLNAELDDLIDETGVDRGFE